MEIADETGALGGSGDYNQSFQRNVSQNSLGTGRSGHGNGLGDGDGGSSLRSMDRNDSQVPPRRGRAARLRWCPCAGLADHLSCGVARAAHCAVSCAFAL